MENTSFERKFTEQLIKESIKMVNKYTKSGRILKPRYKRFKTPYRQRSLNIWLENDVLIISFKIFNPNFFPKTTSIYTMKWSVYNPNLDIVKELSILIEKWLNRGIIHYLNYALDTACDS